AAVPCRAASKAGGRAGALPRHGIYYYLPGILRHLDTEAVVSLIAPRPFLAMTGASDGGSPAAGVRAIGRVCAPLWTLHGARRRFASVLLPRQGHVYTPAMWRRTLAWFDAHL